MLAWMITSSILIIVVIGIRKLLRGKISERLRYALWLLVLIRLLIPQFPMESALSILNFMPKTVNSNYDFVISKPITTNTNKSTSTSLSKNSPTSAQLTDTTQSETMIKQTPTASITSFGYEIHLDVIFRILWLSGMIIVSLMFLISNLRFRHELRIHRRKIANDNIKIPIYEINGLESSCLYGVFSPAIYLLEKHGEEPNKRECILSHELTHYQHKDHIWSGLRCLCLIMHWYNPLVWLAANLSKRDAELACDEGTMIKLGEDRREEYARILISIVTSTVKPKGLLYPSTSMTGKKASIKERIVAITRKSRTLISGIIVVIIVAMIGILSLMPKATSAKVIEPAANETSMSQEVTIIPQDITIEPQSVTSVTPINPSNIKQIALSDYFDYVGYLDEVNIIDSTDINGNPTVSVSPAMDYDGDGLLDRLYRDFSWEDLNGNPIEQPTDAQSVDAMRTKVIELHFGNGDKITLTKTLDDWQSEEPYAYDVTGDGINEIIYVGRHGGSTNPESDSEITVFRKENDGYEIMTILDDDSGFPEKAVEHHNSDIARSIAFYYTIDSKIDETSTFIIKRAEGYNVLSDFRAEVVLEKDIYDNYDYFYPGSEFGSVAYDLVPYEFNQKPGLAAYLSLGDKWSDKNVIAVLQYDEAQDALVCVDMHMDPQR
jgi:beta-lactamase regulating signal transducer with metallopeptidase domain